MGLLEDRALTLFRNRAFTPDLTKTFDFKITLSLIKQQKDENTVSRVITVVLKCSVRTQPVYLSFLHVKRKTPNTLVYFIAVKALISSWRYLEALTDIQTPLGVISCIGDSFK